MELSPEEVTTDDFNGCRHAHIEGYLLFNRALTEAVLATAKAAGVGRQPAAGADHGRSSLSRAYYAGATSALAR